MKIDRCAKVPSKVYEKLLSAIIQQPVSVSVAS
jgi:3-methyladenine DNA glycosylase/8-oxoguanine DNA glycosylase